MLPREGKAALLGRLQQSGDGHSLQESKVKNMRGQAMFAGLPRHPLGIQ